MTKSGKLKRQAKKPTNSTHNYASIYEIANGNKKTGTDHSVPVFLESKQGTTAFIEYNKPYQPTLGKEAPFPGPVQHKSIKY
ncbi:hypothetical protein BGP75_09400 [Motiliproteus sp. MSK22-1]|nr:hypothetical protein BGP75_09400 [Motiliproteus sp. MSK22-1]